MLSSCCTSLEFLCVKHNAMKTYKGHETRDPDRPIYSWRNNVQYTLNRSLSVGGCMSSVTQPCVVVWIVPRISKDHSAFIFKGQAVEEQSLLHRLLGPWRWRQYDPLESQEPLIQRVPHPTRHEPLATPLQEPQISQPLSSFTHTSVTFCHRPHFRFNCKNNSCHCLKYFIIVSLKFYFLHLWQNISQQPWLPQSKYPKSGHNSWWWFISFIFSILLLLMMI